MPSTFKKEKTESLIKEVISDFIRSKIGQGTIVSIMALETSRDLHLIKVYASVFPEEKRLEVAQILKMHSGEIKEYLQKHTRLKNLPFVEIVV